MEFRIADTFTSSLTRLTRDEQKAVKTTAFDLQLNPANPGMKLHKVHKARDKNFCSVRVSGDLRMIVHKTDASFLLCYVDHHDDAYDWATRREIERHPKTGAAQLVEIRETVCEIETVHHVEAAPEAPRLFVDVPDDELLGYGIPEDWLTDVRQATEDSLLDLTDHLPGEAAEALLELATGGHPEQATALAPADDPFAHPDAQRRFRGMTKLEELQRALEYPWERWTIFLHPAQRETVERRFSGPARVSGSAGTGKTIVGLHRAVFLARAHPRARVLLTTFSEPLAYALRHKLARLVDGEDALARRLTVAAIDGVGLDLYEAERGPPCLVGAEDLTAMLQEASRAAAAHKFSPAFLEAEWREVVDAWGLKDWEAYKSVPRLGRKTRLGEKQRALLWSIFEAVRERLEARGLLTLPEVHARAAERVAATGEGPFDFVVIDEAQDLGVAQLKLLAALGGSKPDGLFFCGDLGQRIFQTPFSWRSLGVDVRGRSRTLRIKFRTSH